MAPAIDAGYDIFYAQKKAVSGANWSKNVRVSDRSSLATDLGNPDPEIDLAVAGDTAIAVWSDRRDVTSIDDRDSDVYASWIRTGTSCQ